VERLGDHAVRLSQDVLDYKTPIQGKNFDRIQEMSSYAISVMDDACLALFKKDYDQAEKSIESANNIQKYEKQEEIGDLKKKGKDGKAFLKKMSGINSKLAKNENEFIQDRKNALREATRNAEKAFRSGDPGIVQTALLKWGTAVWTDDPPQGLEQIGERMPELKNGINDLNSVLYGNNQTKESSLENLFNDFLKVSLIDKKFNNNKGQSQLEPLYPEQI